ncbi:hypothetical protein D3C78_1283170 [compost metagenome]
MLGQRFDKGFGASPFAIKDRNTAVQGIRSSPTEGIGQRQPDAAAVEYGVPVNTVLILSALLYAVDLNVEHHLSIELLIAVIQITADLFKYTRRIGDG